MKQGGGTDLKKVLMNIPPPQVFYPKDSYSHPVQLDLLFRQVRASLPFLPQYTQQGNGYIDKMCAHLPSALLEFGP